MAGIASAGFVLGTVLTLLPFVTGTSTLAACDFGGAVYGRAYDLVGIYPPGYSVRIAWNEMMVYWSDGCNGHVSSLWPSVVGIAFLAAAAVISYRLHT
ncbi:hypothetical protein BRD05_08645 [Halobacteriales archaeon QS_9_70_65]|nr:MAG: hypothetical protein BRD05_08645 [Halobacteriales archaeon QS_9_70_65]